MSELNILEEPIENLQFRDWPGHEIVALYLTKPSGLYPVLCIAKDLYGFHSTIIYQINGCYDVNTESQNHYDIIRKKRTVADWMIWSEHADGRDYFYRSNGIIDAKDKHPKSFKIPGTEREI